MSGRRSTILVFVFAALALNAYSQCPAPDFNLPATACQQQNLTLTNLSSAGSFAWDYCTGDLANTPTASAGYTLAGVNGRPSFEYAKDGNKWYAFVTGTFSNRLYRIEVGPDPSQAPSLIENLGDLGGKIHGPGAIRIINVGGNWFGLLHNIDNGELLKLSFGNSLANNITVTSLFTGIGSTNAGLAVAHDDTDGWVCILTTPANNFQVIRLGENLSVPAASDILVTASVPNPNNLFDIDLVRECNQWFAFASNLGNGNVYRVGFGTSLFQQPVITQVADLGGLNGARIRIVKDGEQYYLLEATLGGAFYKVALGDDLANLSVSIKNEGTFSSLLQNTIGVGAVVNNGVWTISVVDSSTGAVSLVKYPNICSATEFISSDTAPGIFYSQQGTYDVSLTMTNAAGLSSTITKSITVSSLTSPDISVTTQDVCVGHNVTFTPHNTSGNITIYDWDFNDASAHSAATQPVHTYSSAATYAPSLVVQASNGCFNNTKVSLKLYDQPVADFDIPAGLVCTNNEYTLVNNTTGNYDGLLQYSWSANGTPVGTSRDLTHTFAATGSESIKLAVSIPGCSDQLTKMVNGIDSGPNVGFTFTGQCQQQQFLFNNTSSGNIISQSWAFDDGITSVSVNPQHIFQDARVYSVGLSVTGDNGCVSTTHNDVTVYSTPQPAFSLDLPPFSCSGTPSQFHDATPSMPESNIQSWNWTFGDSGLGTGKDPTHTYATAGPYTVRLAVSTDRGCSNFADQQIDITASPVALFNFDPACVGQPTHFTDLSTGGIASWQWKVGSTTYTSQNPTHTFASPGNFNMQLLVTGQNNCTNILTRPVNVPVVPALDFQVTNLCSGQAAVFSDVTVNAADPIAQHAWTFNSAGTASGQQASYSFDAAGTYPVELAVQAQSGCSYTLTRPITIRTSPVASFTMSDQSGPPPLHVIFTNTSAGAGSYAWTLSDGTPQSTAVSIEHTFNTLGDYNVSLTALSVNGCSTTETKVVNVITPIDELELEDFSLVQATGTSAYQGFLRVKNNGNYRIEHFIVNYDVGGGIRLSETVPAPLSIGEVKTFLLATTFTQPGTAAFICAELNADTNPLDNKACYALTNEPVFFNVNPNPASSFVNIESVNADAGEVRVRLYNMSGGVTYDRSFNAGAGLSRLSIDVQNLSPGMYVAVVTAGGKSVSARLFIHR